jgi:cytidylate kinase
MKIGISINEVLRDFIGQLAYTYDKYIGETDVTEGDVTNFNLIEFFKFDWALNKRNEKVVIENHPYLIIEGVGSSVKKVSEHACLKIWIEVEQNIGIQRVLNRDGQQIKAQMLNWQIQEMKYFKENKTKENSNIWIDGSPEVNIDTSSQFVRTNR